MSYTPNLEKKMAKKNVTKKVLEEKDFIKCPKYGNSLTKFVNKNSEGVEDTVIARLLGLTEKQVKQIYSEAVKELRKSVSKK
jgi:DNA-directed RNA polymerase specialized sigma subunit